MAALGAAAGGALRFDRWSPHGFLATASAAQALPTEGKDGLTVLTERPMNAETPPHLLDEEVTPVARHFIRNNGIVPMDMDPADWRLRIDGLVDRPMTLSIEDMRNRFEVVTCRLVIECGGNGRAYFDPPVRGNQWTYGAVACSEWTGVRLADVLTVSCVGSVPAPVWDVGLAFADRVASGWYSVSWDSFSVAAARPADWSAADGFLESPDAHPFVAAVLSPVPFLGEVVMGALRADPRVVFNVTGLEFEAFATFDSERIRAVVGALAGACGGAPAPRG